MITRTLAVVGIALLGACNTGQGDLAVQARMAENSLARTGTDGTSLEMTTTVGALVVDRVQISVSEIEIEGGSKIREKEHSTGAAVVDVSLAGEATAIAVERVPAGKYQEIGLELARLNDDAFDGASILVEGTFEDQPFVYGSGVAPEIEFDLDTPVRVEDGGTAAISIVFDVASWFVANDGTVLDPGDIDNRDVIEDNILDSMRAMADDFEAEGDDDDDDDDDGQNDDDDKNDDD